MLASDISNNPELRRYAARHMSKPTKISCAIDQLKKEAQFLPTLADTIMALARYAKTLLPNSKYIKEGERYVLRPDPFVTFTVRHKRRHHVTITLRGFIGEFEIAPELPLKNGRAQVYSECNLRNPNGLAAAAAYIQRACQLLNRGPSRTLKKPVKTEVPLSGG